jgi:hypothetical protein
MAAVQLTGPPAINDDPLPLLRRERQVDDQPVDVAGDEVADQVRVRERMLNGGENAAIGARRLPGSSWNFDGDPTEIVMVRR